MKIFVQLSLVTTFYVAFSLQQSCSIQSNKDIALPNLAEVNGQRLENCCNICRDTPQCQGYAWNDYRGGTCWLKAGTGPIIQKDGVSVGTLSGNDGGEAACWWSGCQPSNWGQRGCFPADQWRQSRSESCPGGDRYFCCPAGGQTNPSPGGQGLVSYDQFSNAVVSNGYPRPSQAVYDAYIQGLPRGSISSKEEAAMALAQFLHESAGLTAKREFRCMSNGCPGEYATPGCDASGKFYYGRGYIQLTWCNNYRAASRDLLGNDSLVTDPDQVASNENLAWNTAFWFWKVNVHGQAGVSNGFFGATTKAINGFLECSGNNSVARKRFEMYGKVRAAFGLNGPGDERGCYN
ncbi:hypothetical protein HA402_014827 [Bradysia odoriphaga]|nr:hypothetical protein HA402_014827 [Bradysia odoriphaga]